MTTNLKFFREKAGITQAEFARRIGVKPPLLCQVENGQRKPWPKLLKDAATALDVPETALLADLNIWEGSVSTLKS